MALLYYLEVVILAYYVVTLRFILWPQGNHL